MIKIVKYKFSTLKHNLREERLKNNSTSKITNPSYDRTRRYVDQYYVALQCNIRHGIVRSRWKMDTVPQPIITTLTTNNSTKRFKQNYWLDFHF